MTYQSDPMRARFWRELSDLRTGMLRLATREAQPMTAHFDQPDGPVWFIARRQSPMAGAAAQPQEAVFTYVARGHDLYACVSGRLSTDQDRAVLDRFWTAEVARWFPDKEAAAVLRFDPAEGQVWIPGESADAHEIGFDQPQARRAAM